MAATPANLTTAEPAPNITTLPLELLWEVASYLPVSGHIALKLCNKGLFVNIPTPPRDWDKTASRCERKAHRRIVNEREELGAGRRRCVNCDLVTYAGRFPSSAPLCKWHEPRHMSNSIPAKLDATTKASLEGISRENNCPAWVAFERIYCAHNREVVGWHEGDCNCECDSCGHFLVPCFIRSPSKRDTRQWRSSKLTEDGLAVNEEHWIDAPGKSLKAYRQTVPIIQLESLYDRVRNS